MSHPLFDISGRTALVTGSSRGIGFALARGLAEAGCTVVLNGRDGDRLTEVAAGISDVKQRVPRHVQTELTQPFLWTDRG